MIQMLTSNVIAHQFNAWCLSVWLVGLEAVELENGFGEPSPSGLLDCRPIGRNPAESVRPCTDWFVLLQSLLHVSDWIPTSQEEADRMLLMP